MLPVTSAIAEAVHKWLLAGAIPGVVLVLSGVPHDLVHDLWNGDRMRAWACWGAETSAVGISNVALVVRRIEIFAVPAGGEDDGSPNAARAILVGKLSSVFGIAGSEALAVAHAAMADGCFVGFFGHWVAGDHAEAGLEGGHLAVLGAVWHVVDGHASVLLEPNIGELRHTVESAVLGRLEVQGGSPVVAEVLGVGARSTGGLGRRIVLLWLHLYRVSDVSYQKALALTVKLKEFPPMI